MDCSGQPLRSLSGEIHRLPVQIRPSRPFPHCYDSINWFLKHVAVVFCTVNTSKPFDILTNESVIGVENIGIFFEWSYSLLEKGKASCENIINVTESFEQLKSLPENLIRKVITHLIRILFQVLPEAQAKVDKLK